MQSESKDNNSPPSAGQPENVLTDEQILAEFEARVREGHSRENAKRLTRDLFGRAALGDSGRTRAAIHDIVAKSKVRKPEKAEAEYLSDDEKFLLVNACLWATGYLREVLIPRLQDCDLNALFDLDFYSDHPKEGEEETQLLKALERVPSIIQELGDLGDRLFYEQL